ncbi:MAG TPA: metallophosphoesterase family protein [Phycisphaerae bacterium]|nr:metallophosphoesterase family protein [Phycisphaerae bacterium]
MKIGILSDSHGRLDLIREALRIFAFNGVDAIVHCGDVGPGECVDALAEAKAKAKVYVVAGNMDKHVEDLATRCKAGDIEFATEVVRVPLGDGRFLAATHGDDEQLLGELIAEKQFAYVCHGHTHKHRDDRADGVRVINPGAMQHTKVHTVAVLDTDTDMLEHILVH